MTGYTVHTGSNEQFREGWDRVFKAKKTDKTKAEKTGQPKGGKDAVKKPKPRKK